MAEDAERLRELVAEVAAAYFSNSHVNPGEIQTVVKQIADSLGAVGSSAPAASIEPERQNLTPAQIRKSVTPDALISFEDNKPYKTLKRHLATRGLTPAQYREKWGLPSDYPTVSPNYSAARSNLAKSMGLGEARKKKRAAAAAPAAETAPAKRRGRPKKQRAVAAAPAAEAAPAKRPGRPKTKRATAEARPAPAAGSTPAKRRGRPKKTKA